MATIIKALNHGSLTAQHGNPATLYGPPSGTTKSAIVKNIRFVNTSDSDAAELKLTLSAQGQSKQITPSSGSSQLTVPAKGLFVLKDEIPLAAGESILGSTNTAGEFDYVVSGMEKDQ